MHETIEDVRKIVVLRPGAVGDFMMTLPALHALRDAYPEAEIVYVGKAWHAGFLANRPGPVDWVAVIPPCPGVGAPPESGGGDRAAIKNFLDAMRAERFDLAVQLHGGGRYSNPLIRKFDARVSIGLRAADAEALDRWIPYGRLQNRRLHMLAATALAGASKLHVGQELQVTAHDREEAADVVRHAAGKRLVVMQPGSTDLRRCWPAASFAALADRLAAQGALVALNGTEQERPLVAGILERMQHTALDLSGMLSLSGLCGLLARADLMVSNDTGPLHLALAVGTPSVGIYWLTNLIESGPLREDIHAAVLSLRMHCSVCGAENLTERCPHDASFVDGVTVDEVAALAEEMLRR
jgi:ADP-heptose:LPS heptosyltransferase